MAFEPDIIVHGPEGTTLVVEVKATEHAGSDAAEQLKHYMAGMSIPLGLLVTPRKLVLYRDKYVGTADGSIEEVGAYSLADILSPPRTANEELADPRNRGLAFEEAVQHWLERLSTESDATAIPADVRDALETHILPVLRAGEVRAAGPRLRNTAF
ncbi:MAG: hypothetical protein RL701_199 [Pseudomonadota bacterium]|jgi:hypothetical protein